MKNKSYFIRLLALLIGAAIFVFTIQTFGGVDALLKNLLQMRYFYVFVALNSFLWMLAYTEAWFQLLVGVAHKLKYRTLLKIKLSGEGVNFMTPLGFIAGDPVRILMLEPFVGKEARLRSVVIDRTMHSFAAQVFNLVGISLIFTQNIDFPVWIHWSLLILYGLLSSFFFLFLFCLSTGRGFGPFEGPLNWIGLEKRFPKVQTKLQELRVDLEFYKDRSKKPFFVCFALHFLGRFLGAIEILIIFYALQGRVDFMFSWIMISLSSFVAIIGGFIPGALGLLEGLYANFAVLYGFSPEVGLGIQIVRRLRVWFWIAIGIVVLDYQQILDFFNNFRGKSKPSQDK